MSSEKERPAGRRRGRPPGRTLQGLQARERLYRTAIRLIAERGYEATTLREIARKARVSPGLLYRYFPSKVAVVLALYDALSGEYCERARGMPAGKWPKRFLFALNSSLTVLGPHRSTLAALVPVLVGDRSQGLFAASTAFSRRRVQQAFYDAVTGASDSLEKGFAAALGRLLYLVHLSVILWWLLDKSPGQRATAGLVVLLERTLPVVAAAVRLSAVRDWIVSTDRLLQDAFLGD